MQSVDDQAASYADAEGTAAHAGRLTDRLGGDNQQSASGLEGQHLQGAGEHRQTHMSHASTSHDRAGTAKALPRPGRVLKQDAETQGRTADVSNALDLNDDASATIAANNAADVSGASAGSLGQPRPGRAVQQQGAAEKRAAHDASDDVIGDIKDGRSLSKAARQALSDQSAPLAHSMNLFPQLAPPQQQQRSGGIMPDQEDHKQRLRPGARNSTSGGSRAHPAQQPHPRNASAGRSGADDHDDIIVGGAAAAAAKLLDEKWVGGTVAGEGNGYSQGQRSEQQRPVVAKVDRRVFERILFSFDTMPHHLPDTYLAALQQL